MYTVEKVADLMPETFIKKETLAQVFSCEFCEISKNTSFTEHLRGTASELLLLFLSELENILAL